MPAEFLTQHQKRHYGRYVGEPTPEQLARYFHLDDADLQIIRKIQGKSNRFGFAVQLCTVRFLGVFPAQFKEIPRNVVDFIAVQIDVRKIERLSRYSEKSTRWRHAETIRALYGYREFTDPREGFLLVRWLYVRAWMSDERPSHLFDLATARLLERKVLLPGATVLARLVLRIRERASRRLWSMLCALPSPEQIARLEALLIVPEGHRTSDFDRLRRGPHRISGPALVGALKRVSEIRALGVKALDSSRISSNRLKALARYALTTHASRLSRMPKPRRIATLLAFALSAETTAMDDALDVFDALMTDILSKASAQGKKERLRTLRDLDEAALCLVDACHVLFDESVNDGYVRKSTFSVISPTRLRGAMATIHAIARPRDDNFHKERVDQYGRVQRFLSTLLRVIAFQGTSAGQPVLDALAFLKIANQQRHPDFAKAPREVIPRKWRHCVFPRGQPIDRRAYTLCVLEQLQDKLRRRDIYVSPSERWGDPRLKLISEKQWPELKTQVCRCLERNPSATVETQQLATYLDECYRYTVSQLPKNPAVRIETKKGRARFILTGLDKLDEPKSLRALKDTVRDFLPRIDLPEALLEIHAHTQFADEFTHISERDARVDNLATSICAVLMADACNIGLEPIVRPDIPALTRNRLSWVRQNYIRIETLTQANARLVNAQAKIPLAKLWGGGAVASADGLRFVTPTSTVHAGPNPKYFGRGRGVTYLNFVSDQFTQFHGIVIPGTLRDSLFILEGLLEQQTSLDPKELMTDTASASDIIFGLFWLLGYQFSPRLADVGGARFWRIDPHADYGPLNDIARHRIKIERIIRHWDDLLRIVGSLKTGTISASELIRSLLQTKRPSSLVQALIDLGRISKTIHNLNYINDAIYRRRTLIQINHGESRNGVSRELFLGKRGELRQRYRQGQENQLSALGLVVNVLILWNTIYTEAVLNHLTEQNVSILPEDVARLSPLGYDNFNFIGRYSFNLSPEIAHGELRPISSTENSKI